MNGSPSHEKAPSSHIETRSGLDPHWHMFAAKTSRRERAPRRHTSPSSCLSTARTSRHHASPARPPLRPNVTLTSVPYRICNTSHDHHHDQYGIPILASPTCLTAAHADDRPLRDRSSHVASPDSTRAQGSSAPSLASTLVADRIDGSIREPGEQRRPRHRPLHTHTSHPPLPYPTPEMRLHRRR